MRIGRPLGDDQRGCDLAVRQTARNQLPPTKLGGPLEANGESRR